MAAKIFVLERLKKAKNRGVKLTDFPAGFRLSARIKDLRDDGHDILTTSEDDYSGGYKRKIARYVLK